MGRDSEATLVDTWGPLAAGDDPHQDAWPHESSRETQGAGDRFELYTQPAKRRRIPLTSRPSQVVTLEADAPPAPRVAEGSSPDVFRASGAMAIPVEVRLRRSVAPTSAQVDDVMSWLRSHRPRAAGTPRPEPAPPPAPALVVAPLLPVVGVEPPRRGAIWPLVALMIGLAAAVLAAMAL